MIFLILRRRKPALESGTMFIVSFARQPIPHHLFTQFLVWRVSSAQNKRYQWSFHIRRDPMLISFLQCDRQIPCSHVRSHLHLVIYHVAHTLLQCIARKVPELCKAYTPGKTDQDLSVRLARLEHIVEHALPQYFHHSGSPSAGTPDRQKLRQLRMS
jgi:hypothetical protein